MKLISEETRIQQINALPNISFVRWDGEYKNSRSNAVVRCAVDGLEWSATVHHLVNNGSGCPQCSGKRLWTAEERIAQINELPNISFIRWDGMYKNGLSKAVCRCSVDGLEWQVSVHHLINSGKGCPQCAGSRRQTAEERVSQINELPNMAFVRWMDGHESAHSKAVVRCTIDGHEWVNTANKLINSGMGCLVCSRRARILPADERIEQINSLPNIYFIRWESGYKNAHSRAVCQCAIDGYEWTASVNNLTNNGSGCPACAQGGYNPAAPGTLYALRSECGTMVKIGISNNHKRRHTELRNVTPFNWHCIELLHNNDGAFIAKAEKELHSLTEQAQFSEPFDGYTEWRKWDDRIPMLIEEYRARA